MAKYGGLDSAVDGVTTANQDLHALAKTKKSLTGYKPWKKVSFIPEGDCTIKVNDQDDVISVKADIGWSDDNTQISKFEIVEAGVAYILSYRY